MAVTKIYVDLTKGEEKKANELIQDCRDIIESAESIRVTHQDAEELV